MISWPIQLMLLILVLVAASFDIASRRIPNWLVAIGLAWGMLAGALSSGWPGLKASLIGSLVAFIAYVPLFIVRGMGAGDVKLMMAVGALVGPANWLLIFVITAALGSVAALLTIVWRRRVGRTLRNIVVITRELCRCRLPYLTDCTLSFDNRQAHTMPHGATIAAASMLFLISRLFLK